jgi:hypothetical protein
LTLGREPSTFDVMKRWIAAVSIACLACKEERLTEATKQPPPQASAVVTDASTGPDMCEQFFTAVDRLAVCAQMDDANRDTFKKLAREVQDSTERPFGKGELAKCQMSLHMLRIDVTLDCPELAAQIPNVEIPM